MVEIRGKTAQETWKKVLAFIMKEGEAYKDRRNKLCKETLNLTATIETPEEIFKPFDTLNKFNKWVYPSLDEIKKSILYKENSSEYYYNYGKRAFYMDKVNQIDDYILPLLKKTPTSKRGIVVFYSPKRDTLPLRKETPGMVMVNFAIRNKKLCCSAVIRSNDMFHGWPANVAQIYFLTQYIAEKLNYQVGEITTYSISAHIFESQFEDIKKVVGKKFI
jgi:thymidylate synthase